jgi:hypothetical protein
MNNSYVREKATGLGQLIADKKAKEGVTYTTDSLIDGTPLTYQLIKISSNEINNRTFPSPFNHRASEYLSVSAVHDILPTIRKHKRNSKSAIGVMSGGKIEILEGLRRRFAVTCVPGANYHVLVFDNMTEAEKSIRCSVSDIYTAPSVIDLGIKIIKYAEHYETINSKPLTVNDLSDVFFVSSGKISEARKFGLVNPDFYKLFPSLQSIGYKFMRSVLSLSKLGSVELDDEFCSQFSYISNDIEDVKILESQVKTLKEQILSTLQPQKSSEPFASLFNENNSYIEGTDVKITKKSAVISLDHDKVPDSVQEQIIKLLKAHD